MPSHHPTPVLEKQVHRQLREDGYKKLVLKWVGNSSGRHFMLQHGPLHGQWPSRTRDPWIPAYGLGMLAPTFLKLLSFLQALEGEGRMGGGGTDVIPQPLQLT